MLVDTHCHIFSKYYENIEEIMEKMKQHILIVIGIDMKTNQQVLDLCEKYPNVYGAIGFHPCEIEHISDSDFKWIEQSMDNPKIVGIGETGLDYYWDITYKEKQKLFFQKHIELAQKYQKSLVVHSRSAKEDTYEILSNSYKEKEFPMVLHCFSYDIKMAEKYINLNASLGIGGAVTYSKSLDMKEVVKKIPFSHILLETDSPYMTPNPYRGKKNEPSYIMYVAQEIANIKDISLEEVEKITTGNALRQFDLNI